MIAELGRYSLNSSTSNIFIYKASNGDISAEFSSRTCSGASCDESFSDRALRQLLGSDDAESRGELISRLSFSPDPSVTNALIDRLNSPTETPLNRYLAINAFTHQHHLQNLSSSSVLLETLSDLALQEEEDHFVRYGAFVLLSSVNTRESLNLLDAHESEFLELVEANYTENLPFYLPPSLSSDQPESPLVLVAAIDPYLSPSNDSPFGELLQPIIPSIFQGANPGETRQQVTARLAGKPAVCRFAWVAQNWNRCGG